MRKGLLVHVVFHYLKITFNVLQKATTSCPKIICAIPFLRCNTSLLPVSSWVYVTLCIVSVKMLLQVLTSQAFFKTIKRNSKAIITTVSLRKQVCLTYYIHCTFMFSKVKLFACVNMKCAAMFRCTDRGIHVWKWERVSRNMFCSSRKKEWQEPVTNTDMQLESGLDENRKFKY